MELPLIITIEQDLSPVNSKPAQVRTVVHEESKVWFSETVEYIRYRSSIKACSKGSSVLLVVNLETFNCKDYSSIIFILKKNYRKRIIEKVQPANVPS